MYAAAGRRHLVYLAIFLLVAGCGDGRDSASVSTLPVTSLPGVFTGVFPCQDCPGIASTLWLRSDGRFFFRQAYAADDTRDAFDAYSLGRWNTTVDEYTLELSGAGPKRTFVRLDADTLIMQTSSNLEHRLVRDPGAPEFSASIRMAGEMRVHDKGASFTECLTGFVVPVSKGGEYSRFWHQYRSAGRLGKPTFVEFDGRFSWSGDGAPKLLTIERFVTVRTDGAC